MHNLIYLIVQKACIYLHGASLFTSHVTLDKSLFYLTDTKQTAPSWWHTSIIWSSVQSPVTSSQFNSLSPETSFRAQTPSLSSSTEGFATGTISLLLSISLFSLSKLMHFVLDGEERLSMWICEGYTSRRYLMAEALWNLQWLFRRNKHWSSA